ncbi:hypothetical protein [Pyxidicoccus xibeiensis]|uniref:hypothetical protein n=1 Tax=Pyxidicoccus xibeiensis TaxID=2906759 RepID=UPI0020A71812|nr:hypothetical protein [Pyxidicoccus xibeiensis]MCP3138898.1 hypothetical protein [Pyxidicoccus xibeiensis]
MSSIRRVLSGISSSIARARMNVDVEPVTPLTPGEPLEPVAPVRRGFSDESDFQADVDDLGTSLEAHAPHLTGAASAPGLSGTPGAAGTPTPAQLRVFSGESSFESSFESATPRYAQLLGSQLPSSLGAPREAGGGVAPLGAERGSGGRDMNDLLSPEAAEWELQNLDTSTPSVVEPEDLLFMLDPPGTSGPGDAALELGLEDVFEEAPLAGNTRAPSMETPEGVGGIDDVSMEDAYAARLAERRAAQELLDPAVSPAGADAFLADTSDLGSLLPEEPSMGDAALAGVLGPLAANPAAAGVPVSAALASQGVDVVAETLEVEPAQDSSVVVDPSLLEKSEG